MKRGIWFVCLFALLLVPLRAAKGEAADASALSADADIRVMSYNILHPDWSHVPVQGRDTLVADILLRYRPDVAAIREAGAKWHKALKALLVDTGCYAPACRQSNAEGFIYCTTTFLYNPQTVRLVEDKILDPENTDSCIDHLFVSGGADVKLFNAVIGCDIQNASDHIPIYADLALK